jgi:hypothetical protein
VHVCVCVFCLRVSPLLVHAGAAAARGRISPAVAGLARARVLRSIRGYSFLQLLQRYTCFCSYCTSRTSRSHLLLRLCPTNARSYPRTEKNAGPVRPPCPHGGGVARPAPRSLEIRRPGGPERRAEGGAWRERGLRGRTGCVQGLPEKKRGSRRQSLGECAAGRRRRRGANFGVGRRAGGCAGERGRGGINAGGRLRERQPNQ